MADRIKGITVEIGGDTTKLSDALKNVNKSIRETQDQLRDVNKLLSLPGHLRHKREAEAGAGCLKAAAGRATD
jgi:phage-related minor tail protein